MLFAEALKNGFRPRQFEEVHFAHFSVDKGTNRVLNHQCQVNLTDPDSRITPVAGGGFEQAYNAQATVAAGSLLVITADVVQAANDKQQIEPALEQLGQLPDELGKAETLLADSGYFSQTNDEALCNFVSTTLRPKRSEIQNNTGPGAIPQNPVRQAARRR